ncbi:MAG: DUF1931 family protein [Kofleriaceae bacterium]|nr:DUF1931 family protein [Kofleriaceae bacterium]
MSVTTPPKPVPPVRPTNIARFERLFRVAAQVDIDKEDLRHYQAFLDAKVADLLVRAGDVARYSKRRLILPHDLPITKGLATCIEEFRRIDAQENLALTPVLEKLGKQPQQDLDYDEETYALLPEVMGGMTVALARSFRIIDPDVVGIVTTHWQRAFQLFDLVW